MILEILQKIKKKVPGFLGIVIIGIDGLPVERCLGENKDLEQLFVEYINLIKKLDSVMQSMSLGQPNELTITGGKINFILTKVINEYYLAMGVDPKTNVGLCRYELKKASLDLKKELTS